MAERGDAGSGPDVPDREGVRKLPGVWQKFVDKGGAICYDTIRVQETAPSYGEMSEWLKEPVLKTGGAQVPVGSNPTLSAKTQTCIRICGSTQVAEGAPLLRE